MPDLLNTLWSCFDSADSHFSGEELNAWDASMRECLIRARVLRQGPAASMIVCPSCPDGHIEEVLAVPDVDPPRFFIPCPETVRVEIDARHIEQWTIDHDMLASIIAASLHLSGRVNPSAMAVKIARAELSAICRAVGVMAPKDSVELHNLPLVIKVGCKKREDTGEVTNEIKGYESRKRMEPAAASTASGSPPPWKR